MTGTRWQDEPISFSPDPRVPRGVSLASCPAVISSWHFSRDRLSEVEKTLRARFDDHEWLSVAFAGSYGRMDAGPESDADFLVLVKNPPSEAAVSAAIAEIRDVLASLSLPLPNPNGLFAAPVDVSAVAKTIGGKDDNLHDLARRMVLILECTCVYNEQLYFETVDAVIGVYMRYQRKEPDKQPLFLINEIIRYYRSICVNYELNFWNEHDKWAIRNAKLRHSRLLMYFGLLSLALNSSVKENKRSYIMDQLQLTPLERVCHVYADCGENDVSNVLGPYNLYLSKINDPTFRKALSKAKYESRYESAEYALLKTTSNAFSAELTRFVFDRHGHWPNKVLGYLFL